MIPSIHRGGLVIFLSVFLALALAVLPMPESLHIYRPQWVALVLIYWCMAVPERVGVGTSFVVGIFLDIVTGSLLGQHAMSLSILAFITLKTHRRVRIFPVWQQAIFVAALLLLDRLFMTWMDGAIGLPAKDSSFFIAPLIGGLLWPWLYIVLRDIRRRFHVS